MKIIKDMKDVNLICSIDTFIRMNNKVYVYIVM